MLRVSLVATVMAVVASANGYIYVEGVNDYLPVQPGISGTAEQEVAYRWTAQHTFDLVLILWHCSPVIHGTTRLREDTGTVPGAILRETTFASAATGWNGAQFSEPYPVIAGETYFVTFSVTDTSIADYLSEGGIYLTYYWAWEGTEDWVGPWTVNGNRMIQFYTADPCLGDVNGDGDIDLYDLALLLAVYGTCHPDPDYDDGADFDENGCVDLYDLAELLGVYGTPCP